MSRDLDALNLAEINAEHLHECTLVKLEFDTPVYVHSGIGSISYGGNTYLGVGNLGSISPLRETEVLGPSSITLSIDAIDSDHITEALDSGNYGDVVTIFNGYRQDDGTLVADPWLAWKGTFEYASISLGEQSVVSITCQHDLAMLDEKHGDRYSDEDQRDKFSGDVGLQYAASTAGKKLLWGGGGVEPGGVGGNRERPIPSIRD